MFAHCFSWERSIDPIGPQVPLLTICTAPSPLLLNKYIVKSLQVFVADSFNSHIYESKQNMLGLAIIRLSQVVYGSAHTSGELISNLPCDEEVSQRYDQGQAFHDSISWAFIWSYLSTWTSKIPEAMGKAKTHTHRAKRKCVRDAGWTAWLALQTCLPDREVRHLWRGYQSNITNLHSHYRLSLHLRRLM